MVAVPKKGKDMAILEQEVGELKTRIERLEATVRRLADEEQQDAEGALDTPQNAEQLLAGLKAQRLLRTATPEEDQLAAEWDALPDEEKQAHIRFMHGLVLDPPLSQLITENRR